MLTWILGYFCSLHRGVSPHLDWGHARALSSLAVAAVLRFPSRGSRDLWLSVEAFFRGFPTGLSHVPPWCELILGLKVEAVQGKQDFPELTETSGGLWEWWHDREFLSPFLWRATPENSFAITLGKDPSSPAMRRKRGSSGCGRDSRASFEWCRVCRGPS